jgi:osmoprotectant transport system permease protein
MGQGAHLMDFLAQVVHWFADPAHWQGDGGIPNRLLEHVEMSGAVMLVAIVIALPLGVLLGHYRVLGELVVNVFNIGQATPAFGILVIAVPIFGIGAKPAFVALLALAIPPILQNSIVAIREVDRDLKEAARGMGMTAVQLLFRLEMPLALPGIMAGVRTSGINVIATATIAALVAWGGLGRFIVDGFGQRDSVQLFAGALLVAALSLAAEAFLATLQRLATPAGLRARGPARLRRAMA